MRTKLAIVFVSLLLLAPLSRADVIFSNLGPGGTYYWNGYRPGDASPLWMAVQFSVSAPYTLASIQLPLLSVSDYVGTNLPVMVSLCDGISLDGMPCGWGSPLETWTLNSLPDYTSPNGTLQTLQSAGTVLDESSRSGGTYWIKVSVPQGRGVSWEWNPDLSKGWVYPNSGMQSSEWIVPAFQVNGVPDSLPVPEPATLVLLGGGLIAMGRAGRLKRRR